MCPHIRGVEKMQAHRRDASREKGYFGWQDKSQQQLPATLDIVAPATLNRPPAPDKDRGKLDAPEVSAGRAAMPRVVPDEAQPAGVPRLVREGVERAAEDRAQFRHTRKQRTRRMVAGDSSLPRNNQRSKRRVFDLHSLAPVMSWMGTEAYTS